MKVEFEVSDFIPASPDQVYSAWLDSEAWDGYITGKNLGLVQSSRIFQQWRTSEFEESDDDSLLEILFESEAEGTRIIIRHTNLPEHGMQYKQGWRDSYFSPMKAYFETKSK
jgi:uncharacterized protein YndB with AHSA1/START domain